MGGGDLDWLVSRSRATRMSMSGPTCDSAAPIPARSDAVVKGDNRAGAFRHRSMRRAGERTSFGSGSAHLPLSWRATGSEAQGCSTAECRLRAPRARCARPGRAIAAARCPGAGPNCRRTAWFRKTNGGGGVPASGSGRSACARWKRGGMAEGKVRRGATEIRKGGGSH